MVVSHIYTDSGERYRRYEHDHDHVMRDTTQTGGKMGQYQGKATQMKWDFKFRTPTSCLVVIARIQYLFSSGALVAYSEVTNMTMFTLKLAYQEAKGDKSKYSKNQRIRKQWIMIVLTVTLADQEDMDNDSFYCKNSHHEAINHMIEFETHPSFWNTCALSREGNYS